ncbi:glycerophosphodiester phosphodiesterase [Pseudohongiella sp.]|uniref:glycerophosphodiester phosphodiesterase n=1 Tax=marine sediment metagenome TaxID=412755 RepID=A0A0F9Y3C8_9ZZZZ|nr:glycerophosphodiester phosphodiesterase [Pseudohongiella sp.]HDZ08829.1 glycerophosphodiester phosphodiesterase [Pseudohongiella sp.]HEA62806.1 glycerophosphodiester phosphodiesterase [Pseudohongiella sp.]
MATAAIKRFLSGVLVMGLVVGNVVPIEPAYAQRDAAGKIVVAHRGASGYLPEHTLPAVAMAYAMGADFMEQDVVMTRDDQLIVWHDLTLDRNTDVRHQFPGRARDDGRHYVVDFDLAELRQLRVTEGYRVDESGVERQIYPQRFPLWQGSFQIHTFAEQLEMVQGMNLASGQDIGIYPEIKSPAFHHDNGKDLSTAIIRELKRFGYTSKDSNVFVQTFEFDELKRVHEEVLPALGVELKLVQLMGDDEVYQWMLSAGGMRDLAQYADGVGPEKGMIISPESTRSGLIISSLVSDAHQAGMQVHPYTFRQDEGQIPAYADDFDHMLELFYFEANVDGVFTDFPDRAVDFLREYD